MKEKDPKNVIRLFGEGKIDRPKYVELSNYYPQIEWAGDRDPNKDVPHNNELSQFLSDLDQIEALDAALENLEREINLHQRTVDNDRHEVNVEYDQLLNERGVLLDEKELTDLYSELESLKHLPKAGFFELLGTTILAIVKAPFKWLRRLMDRNSP